MESYSYFPAVVYRDERPDFVEKLLPTCIQELDLVRQPNAAVIQSNYLANHEAFQEVANYILTSSIGILRGQGYMVENYDFYLQGLWAQELLPGGGTNVHVHKNSQICGWMFLEVPENGAYPVYHDTRMNKHMVELDFVQGQDITLATNTIYFNNMSAGSVLFNNSWMSHQIAPGYSSSPTRCIHFIVSHKDR